MEGSRSPAPTFLDLPHELRVAIYDMVLGDGVYFITFPPDGTIRSSTAGSLRILRVSKQVNEEAQRALRVQTLRINEFSKLDFAQLSRVPRLVSRWASTIQTMFVAYRLSTDSEAAVCEPTMLSCLREITGALPWLRAVTLEETCLHHLLNEVELEARAKKYIQRLGLPSDSFNHITATAKSFERQSHMHHVPSLPSYSVETRFAHDNRPLRTLTYRRDRDSSKGRKVLLEVISNQFAHKQKYWLTVDEVNELGLSETRRFVASHYTHRQLGGSRTRRKQHASGRAVHNWPKHPNIVAMMQKSSSLLKTSHK